MRHVVLFIVVVVLIAGCAGPSMPESGVVATAAAGVQGGVETAEAEAHTALAEVSTRAADVAAAAQTRALEAASAVVGAVQTRLPTPLTTATPSRTRARVSRIVDGDTIVVVIDDQSYDLRYIGMDTPERGEPWSAESTAANRQLVEGQTVYLEKDVSETDRYGRLLRYVYLEDGTFVNAELVRQGYAQASSYPPDIKHQDLFVQMQREAMAASAGLWAAMPTAVEVPPTSTQVSRATPPVTEPPSGEAQIIIVKVDKRAEYVDIQNVGGAAQNLEGWVLVSEKGNQRCPLGGVIDAGAVLRIWAQTKDAGQGGWNCGYNTTIWNNSDPDPAALYDAAGREVARK